MTAKEIMRHVRKWHEQIGDMPSKQVGPEVRQIYREMERVIAQHDNSRAISRNRQQEPYSQKRPAQLTVALPSGTHATRAGGNAGPVFHRGQRRGGLGAENGGAASDMATDLVAVDAGTHREP